MLMPAPSNVHSHGKFKVCTAIPLALRSWGYIPDFTTWQPGDLILTRAAEPDIISREIQTAQAKAYNKQAAAWTHAAIYLGDQRLICEADIDPLARTFCVKVSPLTKYLGTHEILVRRSQLANERENGWAIATAAATRIGDGYDWKLVLKLAIERYLKGREILVENQSSKITGGSVVCSSLYSFAHAYVTRVILSDDTNGLCTPAYLSLDDRYLKTIEFSWWQIE